MSYIRRARFGFIRIFGIEGVVSNCWFREVECCSGEYVCGSV